MYAVASPFISSGKKCTCVLPSAAVSDTVLLGRLNKYDAGVHP